MPRQRIVIGNKNGKPHWFLEREGTRGAARPAPRVQIINDNNNFDDEQEAAAMLRERERAIYADNERLLQDNINLKHQLQLTEEKYRQEAARRDHFYNQCLELQDEVRELRVSVDSEVGQVEHYRRKYAGMKKDNEGLIEKIRELNRQLHNFVNDKVNRAMEDVAQWRRRHDAVEKRYLDMREERDSLRADQEVLEKEKAILEHEKELLLKQNNKYYRMLQRNGLVY